MGVVFPSKQLYLIWAFQRVDENWENQCMKPTIISESSKSSKSLKPNQDQNVFENMFLKKVIEAKKLLMFHYQVYFTRYQSVLNFSTCLQNVSRKVTKNLTRHDPLSVLSKGSRRALKRL